MRRLWLVIALLLLACSLLAVPVAPTQTPVATLSPVGTVTPALPSPTPPPIQAGTRLAYQVRLHPDGGLYVGDLVSFEVIAPEGHSAHDVSVQVRLEYRKNLDLGTTQFAPYGIQGRWQATLTWAWDTHGLEPGSYTVTFTTHPDNVTWTQQVTLLPRTSLDPAEAKAAWASTRTGCCNVFYMTHSEAERDLTDLTTMIDSAASDAAARLGVQVTDPITITLLPRVLGHGGFADDGIQTSYLDRNYVNSNEEMIVHHEIIHILDRRMGGDFRPSLLIEGLAVYMTGGHYKPEPLLPRAAALLDGLTANGPGLGRYIPLQTLVDSFYISQHEIGYLEGGALVEYMVKRWGWQAFKDFYLDIHMPPNSTQSHALEDALSRHFQITLSELDSAFQEELRRQTVPPGMVEDLRQTIALYDTVRRYQQLLDPSAYYLTPWLLDTRQMRAKGITADYLRRPEEASNLALETMLAQAGLALNGGQYTRVERLVKAINAVLDAIEKAVPDPFSGDSLANEYDEIVNLLESSRELTEPLSGGRLHLQRIQVDGDHAVAWVSINSPTLEEVRLIRGTDGWREMLLWEK